MTSPTSFSKFFNKALQWTNFKRYAWLPALNTLLLFLMIPFVILSNGPQMAKRVTEGLTDPNTWQGASWFYRVTFDNPFLQLMLIGMALLWGSLLFNYLNENKSVSFFHGLPLSRRSLFANLTITGLMGLALPILFTALVSMVLTELGSLGLLYDKLDVLWWAANYFLMSALFLASVVFASMVAGLPLVGAFFALVVHLLPVALYGLTTVVLHARIYGFPNFSRFMDWVEILPIIRLFSYGYTGASAGYALVMVLLTAFLFVLAYGLYLKRPMERAGDFIVFSSLRILFKYGFTYCAMLAGGLGLSAILNQPLKIWMMILWAFVGYCIAEMLLQKTMRILSAWKGLASFLLITALVLTGIHFDLMGYQTYVPEEDQIAAVYIQGNTRNYESRMLLERMEEEGLRIEPQLLEYLSPGMTYLEKENIAAVRQIHQRLIDRREDPQYTQNRYATLNYLLENGKLVQRQYRLNLTEHPDLAEGIYASAEQIKYRSSLLFAEPQDLNWLRINNSRRQGLTSDVRDESAIRGLLAALVKDMAAEPFELIEGGRESFYSLEYRYQPPQISWEQLETLDKNILNEDMRENLRQYFRSYEEQANRYDRYSSIQIPSYYTHTLAWIESAGLEERLRPNAQTFQEVRLYKSYNLPGPQAEERYVWEKYAYEGSSYAPMATMAIAVAEEEGAYASDQEQIFTSILDPLIIDMILQDNSYEPYLLPLGKKPQEREVYKVDFFDRNGHPSFTGYYYQGLPDFLLPLVP